MTDLTVLLAAGVMILLICVFAPSDARAALSRVTKFSFAGISAELQESASRAAAEPQEGADIDVDTARTILDLRMRLQAKLSYLAKHVLATPIATHDIPTFLTIGSLHTDQLLNDDEANTADAIMTLRDAQFRQMPEPEQDQFLENATKFVATVRAAVFHAYVAQVLESTGGRVQRRPRGRRRRDDLVLTANGESQTYVPVFATEDDSPLVRTQTERLKKDDPSAIIVIPRLHGSGELIDGTQRVEHLGELLAKIRPPAA